MSVPKFKRKPSGLDYVDNAYNLQVEIMNLCSKLSARWARIYQQPIDKYDERRINNRRNQCAHKPNWRNSNGR
jgi:hypothetical protein